MRRVITALVLAGAIALATPCAIYAQHGGGHAGGFSGGHSGGFSGGHAGGFSGGGFSGPHFAAPSGGFGPGGSTARSFPAPRMNFMPGPINSGVTRFSPSAPRPAGVFNGTRSPFGQLSIPNVRRAPYPGGTRGWTNQPTRQSNNQWHNGDHNGGHDDHHHYRPPYYGGVGLYTWPYSYASWSYWPWWPYFGNWDSNYDYPSDTTAAPAQYPDQNSDQYYAPEPSQQDNSRPAYQPEIAASAVPAYPEPAVTIVYKDGHSQQIHNYALTRTTLLMLDNASSGLSPQIPLDQVNLPATEQINRAAGVDFRVPISN